MAGCGSEAGADHEATSPGRTWWKSDTPTSAAPQRTLDPRYKQKKNVHNQEGDNMHINETVSDIISKYRLLLTRWFLGTDENVGWLRQPLHELGDALRVVLTLAQRTHHGTEDTANDAREQLRVEGFSCCCCARIRCWVGPCPGCWSGTRGRRGWWKDGLGGLEIKWKQYVGV